MSRTKYQIRLCNAAFFKIDAMTMRCGKFHRNSMNFRCDAKFETEKQNFILSSHARKVAYENLQGIVFVVLTLLCYPTQTILSRWEQQFQEYTVNFLRVWEILEIFLHPIFCFRIIFEKLWIPTFQVSHCTSCARLDARKLQFTCIALASFSGN